MPYLNMSDVNSEREEDGSHAYISLSLGPLGENVDTMITQLSAIGY